MGTPLCSNHQGGGCQPGGAGRAPTGESGSWVPPRRGCVLWGCSPPACAVPVPCLTPGTHGWGGPWGSAPSSILLPRLCPPRPEPSSRLSRAPPMLGGGQAEHSSPSYPPPPHGWGSRRVGSPLSPGEGTQQVSRGDHPDAWVPRAGSVGGGVGADSLDRGGRSPHPHPAEERGGGSWGAAGAGMCPQTHTRTQTPLPC